MFRKINISQLIVVFAVLLTIVVLAEWISSRKGGRTFREYLVKVDVDGITSVEVYPKAAGGKKIRLVRENEKWMVESGGEQYNADQTIARTLMEELNRSVPESVAAIGRDRWEQYEVTDTLGTRVKLFRGTEQKADLIIGKFSFSQQPRKMTSYVRLTGEREVYGVDGMLGMSFNRTLNAFRDRSVIRTNSSALKRLTFSYPTDSSFVLQKEERWNINGQSADSAAVANYLSSIRNLTDNRFAESRPEIALTHRLLIEGDNQPESIEISGYYQDQYNFFLESSQNRGNFFNSPDLAKKIFVSPAGFVVD